MTESAPPPQEQPRNPLHGLTLETIVTELAAEYGWDGLDERIPLRCFADAGANLRQVDNAVTVKADKGFAATLLHTNVEAVGENLPCPPAAK